MAQLFIFNCDGVRIDSETLSLVIYAKTLTVFGYATVAAVNDDWGQSLPEGPDGFAATVRVRADVRCDAELTAIAGMAAVLEILTQPRCVASSG